MVVLSFLITVVYILRGLPNRNVTPGGVPWLFRNKSFFGQTIEHIFNIDPTDSIKEGYQKYCKSDMKQPFVLPNVLERDPVVVPHDFVNSLLHAKESQLSFKASISDLFQADHTSNSMAVRDLYDIVVKLVAKDMTNLLHSESIAKALSYEARAGLLEEWGNDTESWVKVPLWSDSDFQNAIMQISEVTVYGPMIIKTFPKALRFFFLDLLSSPPEEGVWDILHEEVQSISPRDPGVWTVKDLDRAILLDSAIKESLRLNGLSSLTPIRKVVQTNGHTLPNSMHLPCGTCIAVPQFSIHRDPELYSCPQEYQPWRFAHSSDKNKSLTDTSGTFLAFGHGRKPCPGRYIFSHIFKLLTAEILLNYEIKPILSRPKETRFGTFLIPQKKLMLDFAVH
ncbi:hypothetical protein ZTR_01834 [Talaromyces verruculosus]|nr:hypothetical protein ZTR_01834 [Talaromyces verruculosus]